AGAAGAGGTGGAGGVAGSGVLIGNGGNGGIGGPARLRAATVSAGPAGCCWGWTASTPRPAPHQFTPCNNRPSMR
ncbi:hypothetical protein OSI78_25705, partial [Mycobacterium ulcerans]